MHEAILTEATVSIPAADVHSPSTNSGTKSTSYYVLAGCKRIKCANCWEPFADNQLLYVTRRYAEDALPYCKSCLWQRKYEHHDDDHGDGLNPSRGLILGIVLGTLTWLALIGFFCAPNAYLSRAFALVGMLSGLALVGYCIGTHVRRT